MQLKLIDKTGSIKAAAEEMNIHFKTAWRLIKEINLVTEEHLGKSVVKSVRGGSSHGGTEVTEFGKELIKQYEELNLQILKFIEKN